MKYDLRSRVLCMFIATATTFLGAPVVDATAAVAPAKGKEAKGKKGKAAAPVAAPDGKTIAVLRFAGEDAGAELRSTTVLQLQEAGYSVKSVALDLPTAASKLKCKDAESDECLGKIGKWLNSSESTATNFIAYGGVEGQPPVASIVVFDTGKDARVRDISATMVEADLIAPIVIPQEIVASIDEYRDPVPGPTPEEKEILATLDEPEKTPEEIAADKRALEEAEKAAAAAQQDAIIDTSTITADLDADFESFCRTGKRKKRATREEAKDLRPKCQRGKFWGYWQPRAWVALGLTSGLAVATGLTYGLAMAARSDYKGAVDDLDAYNAMAGGNPRQDPNAITADGQNYDALATEVSRTGAIVRKRAIVGDVLLGTTLAMAGVLTIMIFQDRAAAKNYIEQEKRLRAISDVRVGPMIGKTTQGAGLGFRF
jgi:hypothetical protein